MLSTPKTSVSPTATMKSHDASMTPSIRIAAASFALILCGGACRSVAFYARGNLGDPLGRLLARRWVHALGGKVFDVDQANHFGVRIPFRAPGGVGLDGLMSVAERKLDMAGRGIPFDADHGRCHLIAGRLFAAIGRHRPFDPGFKATQALCGAVMRLHRNEA